MSYYRPCPYCGASLDPGEICDCQEKEEAALRGANTEDGNAKNDNAIVAE